MDVYSKLIYDLCKHHKLCQVFRNVWIYYISLDSLDWLFMRVQQIKMITLKYLKRRLPIGWLQINRDYVRKAPVLTHSGIYLLYKLFSEAY